jgi:hypothetical protein
VRFLISAILVFSFAFHPSVFAADQIEFEAGARPRPAATKRPLTTQNTVVVEAPVGEQKARITVAETRDIQPAQLEELLLDQKLQNTDVILSTDNTEVVNSALKATSGANDKRLLRIIPIGRLASASEKLAAGFKNYYSNVQDTLRNDRIGLTVLTITVGIDTMIWLHASSFDMHQKTSMIIMNLVMAATFGLDRDLWGKINKPVKNRLIRIFDRFIPEGNLQKVKTIASQYVANFSLGVGIQLTRTSLLSLDHISDVITTGSFWLTAMKLSGLVTLTTFAWSELYSDVNAEKNPVAKSMLKRMGEARGIIMAQLASVAMVLQPHVYGSTPIVSYVIHGTIGLIALMNAHRIVNWLESNKVVNKIYRKIQTFENFINAGLNIENSPQAKARERTLQSRQRQQQRPAGRLQCRALFAR